MNRKGKIKDFGLDNYLVTYFEKGVSLFRKKIKNALFEPLFMTFFKVKFKIRVFTLLFLLTLFSNLSK